MAQIWGKGRKQEKILASPRYLMGVRTDQRSLSKLGEMELAVIENKLETYFVHEEM
jgi:hypothetical protein